MGDIFTKRATLYRLTCLLCEQNFHEKVTVLLSPVFVVRNHFVTKWFFLRISTAILTRDIDIVIMSVCLSVCLSLCPSVRLSVTFRYWIETFLTHHHTFFRIWYSPIVLVSPVLYIWDVMLVWRKRNINKNCLCVTVLCTIIIMHNGMSSSYRLVDCIGLWSCSV